GGWVDRVRGRLALGGPQGVADLREPAAAKNLAHEPGHVTSVTDPRRVLALGTGASAAEESKLQLQRAERCGRFEHLDLQLGRKVPRGLTLCGRIDDEGYPASVRLRLDALHALTDF